MSKSGSIAKSAYFAAEMSVPEQLTHKFALVVTSRKIEWLCDRRFRSSALASLPWLQSSGNRSQLRYIPLLFVFFTTLVLFLYTERNLPGPRVEGRIGNWIVTKHLFVSDSFELLEMRMLVIYCS